MKMYLCPNTNDLKKENISLVHNSKNTIKKNVNTSALYHTSLSPITYVLECVQLLSLKAVFNST